MSINKPLRVIFFTHDSYSLAPARIRCYNFSKTLKKRGINSQVISLVDHLSAKYDGAKRYRISDTKRIWLNIKTFFKLWREKEIIIYIQKIDYHFLAPLLLHLTRGTKIIVDYDDYDLDVHLFKGLDKLPIFRAKPITSLLLKNSSAVVTSSHYLRRLLKVLHQNIYYIPTGVDTESFKHLPRKNNSNNKIVFSWIGVLWGGTIFDNVISIVKAFSKIKNYDKAKLEICGKGIYMQNLKDYILNHRLNNVELKDWIHPAKMPLYLSNIDIGLPIFAGKTKFNMAKSPTKLFEYMAMAKPTITSNIGEARFVIENGVNGFLISSSSSSDLTNLMDTLIENPKLRYEIGINAKKTVEEHYSLNKIGNKLEKILQSL